MKELSMPTNLVLTKITLFSILLETDSINLFKDLKLSYKNHITLKHNFNQINLFLNIINKTLIQS